MVRDKMRLSTTSRADAEAVSRFAELVGPVMAQRTPESVRRHAADALALFLPYDACDIRSANDRRRELVPVLSRGPHATEVMLHGDVTYGQGLSGWVALHRQALLTNTAQLDPRAIRIPGTPSVPEAAIAIPLIATGSLKDVLVVRREGYDVAFTETEFALARSFADLIAIALDNADLRVRLEQEASTDPLTGLPNRRYFSEALGVRARTVQEEGGTLSVLLIDVDGLKLTNDTLGHHEGDRLLTTVAQTLSAGLREGDLAARLAGDEFAVLLAHTDGAGASAIARRLADAIDDAAQVATGIRGVGASVGWAEFGADGRDVEELLIAADRSMYEAKRRNHQRARRPRLSD
jgi:diguanylate cyclase (GGDEF)-like protein